MQPMYCLSARRALCCLLLAAGCGAALARALHIRWVGPPVCTAKPGPQTRKKKKKMENPVVHFETVCRAPPKTQAFYTQLSDWDITQPGPAANINTGAEGING